MYTQARISEQRNAPPRVVAPPRVKDFKRKIQERSPMKALLRSSLIVLMLLGGYAGFASSLTAQHIPSLPTPNPPIVR
jgi:hypothetical protein